MFGDEEVPVGVKKLCFPTFHIDVLRVLEKLVTLLFLILFVFVATVLDDNYRCIIAASTILH